MSINLRNRHLLSLKQHTPQEIEYLLNLSTDLKNKKRSGTKGNLLEGKNVALIFEKPSTRTRCAFTVATIDEGGHPEYLGANDIHLGHKESFADTARVLGRMFDGIEFRGFSQKSVEDLAKYSGVPVWNGLTDDYHPTQVLADFLTIRENFGKLKGVRFAYVGDGRNNVAKSLMIGAAKMGLDFRILAPHQLFPEQSIVDAANQIAKGTGARIMVTDRFEDALDGADAIYTDVWVSMGEEEKFAERIELLKPFQVNQHLLSFTNNPDVKFLHCLPAFHDTLTSTGKEVKDKYGLDAMEVSDEVFRSANSVVFDQAENRMHTIKAVIALTL